MLLLRKDAISSRQDGIHCGIILDARFAIHSVCIRPQGVRVGYRRWLPQGPIHDDCPEVRTSAVSPGAVVMDGPLRKRAAIAHPNSLRPNADAVDGEPSIQNDAAMDTVLTRGDRIFTQEQHQQYCYCV